MKRKYLFLTTFFLAVVSLLAGAPVASRAAEPVQVIQNQWALGIDEAAGCPGDINEGWQHTSGMTLSVCPKNPAPPDGLAAGGAAFKCGPPGRDGNCPAGQEQISWQEFNLQERGVEPANEYTVDYYHFAKCSFCDFIDVDLYGSDDGGQNWTHLAQLMHHVWGDQSCVTGAYWCTFYGDTAVVDHYPLYKLEISGQYTTSLGYKVTGVHLLVEPID